MISLAFFSRSQEDARCFSIILFTLFVILTFITERRAFAYITIGTEFYQLAVVKHRLFAGIITYFRKGVVLKSYSNYDSVIIKLYSITDGNAHTHTHTHTHTQFKI